MSLSVHFCPAIRETLHQPHVKAKICALVALAFASLLVVSIPVTAPLIALTFKKIRDEYKHQVQFQEGLKLSAQNTQVVRTPTKTDTVSKIAFELALHQLNLIETPDRGIIHEISKEPIDEKTRIQLDVYAVELFNQLNDKEPTPIPDLVKQSKEIPFFKEALEIAMGDYGVIQSSEGAFIGRQSKLPLSEKRLKILANLTQHYHQSFLDKHEPKVKGAAEPEDTFAEFEAPASVDSAAVFKSIFGEHPENNSRCIQVFALALNQLSLAVDENNEIIDIKNRKSISLEVLGQLTRHVQRLFIQTAADNATTESLTEDSVVEEKPSLSRRHSFTKEVTPPPSIEPAKAQPTSTTEAAPSVLIDDEPAPMPFNQNSKTIFIEIPKNVDKARASYAQALADFGIVANEQKNLVHQETGRNISLSTWQNITERARTIYATE